MSASIHARLDQQTDALREELKRREGWTDSEIVRRGIQALALITPTVSKKRKFRGVGKYHFGVTDLATNPKYMEGFGES
jgi:hypothetical protein